MPVRGQRSKESLLSERQRILHRQSGTLALNHEFDTAIAKSSQPRNRQGTLLLTAAWWADGAGELSQNRQTVAI